MPNLFLHLALFSLLSILSISTPSTKKNFVFLQIIEFDS